jgi:pimeloyl-ACP methyl ester carboxylesterase
MHYRELGAGEPVVLLHKTPSSSIMFSRVMPILAEAGYRTIAVDTMGYGQSDRPPEPPTEIAYYSRCVIELMDELDIDRASLAGFYTGAKIALETAAAWPGRVERVVLSGISVNPDEEQRAEYLREIEKLGHMKRSIQLDAEGKFLEGYPLSWFRDFIRGDGEQYLLECIAYLQCARNYWWGYEAANRYGGLDRLALVQAPILFLSPRDGLPFVVERTRRAHEATAGSRFKEIPGTTEVCMEDPQTWAGAVLEFFREVDA